MPFTTKWMGWTELECEEYADEQEAIRQLSNKLRNEGFIRVYGRREWREESIYSPIVDAIIKVGKVNIKLENENKELRAGFEEENRRLRARIADLEKTLKPFDEIKDYLHNKFGI